MTQEVAKAFEEQRKINFMLAKDKSIEVDGCSGFVFTAVSYTHLAKILTCNDRML